MTAATYPPDLEKLRSDLKAIVRRIREAMPVEKVSPLEAKAREEWEGFFQGRSVRRVIIYLRSSGCSWVVRQAGQGNATIRPGCFDCSHSIAGTTRGTPITAESYIRQFLTEYARGDFDRCPLLCLYNEGSFFNERELPLHARQEILRIIAADNRIEGLILESLPEYLTDAALDDTRAILGSKYLEIGIGLESTDPLIRDFCVNKSYTLHQYERAAERVKKHAHLLSYVLLKPSFLTEKEALQDAVSTACYAFEHGADVVSIEPVNTSDYNLCGVLSRLGLYRVPWLWTVLEVVKSIYQHGTVRIGGSQFAPQYDRVAHNCAICTKRTQDAITLFNATNDVRCLDALECACKRCWEAELQGTWPALLDRIMLAVTIIHRESPY